MTITPEQQAAKVQQATAELKTAIDSAVSAYTNDTESTALTAAMRQNPAPLRVLTGSSRMRWFSVTGMRNTTVKPISSAPDSASTMLSIANRDTADSRRFGPDRANTPE